MTHARCRSPFAPPPYTAPSGSAFVDQSYGRYSTRTLRPSESMSQSCCFASPRSQPEIRFSTSRCVAPKSTEYLRGVVCAGAVG